MKYALLLCLAALVPVHGEPANLVPNGNFSSTAPLAQWRTDFPYEPRYVENVKYVSAGPARKDGHAVAMNLPPGVAGMQGGKIESAFIKAEPGATYRVEVDCMTKDFSAKLHVEAWALDPKPVDKPDKFRVPARDGMPALVMCYRAQLPDPPAKSAEWATVSREFTLPATVRIAGQEEKPEYLSIKAVTYAATREGGQSFFANFRLTKLN